MRLNLWLLRPLWHVSHCALIIYPCSSAGRFRNVRWEIYMVHRVCWRPVMIWNNHWNNHRLLFSVCFLLLVARIKLHDMIRNQPPARSESATLLWTRPPRFEGSSIHRHLLFLFVCFLTVMRRNPFMVDGCCRKGSRNALQELYNPTQVGRRRPLSSTPSCSCMHVSSHPRVKGLSEVHTFPWLRVVFFFLWDAQQLDPTDCWVHHPVVPSQEFSHKPAHWSRIALAFA